MPKLSLVERGVQNIRAREPLSGQSPPGRLPITPTILQGIRSHWAPRASDFNTTMLWAACCTAFFGFFRVSEFTSPRVDGGGPSHCLRVEDVAIDDGVNPAVVRLLLRSSKTDQAGRGTEIFLGRTNEELCPVSALLAYLAVRGQTPGPIFRLEDGRYLTKEIFTARVREALAALGLVTSRYAGHSFRIGAATTAAERGIEDALIKRMGRWESSAYQLYVRASGEAMASLSGRLATTN